MLEPNTLTRWRLICYTTWQTVECRSDRARMGDYLLIFLSTALVNNVVLVRFLGLCPSMGVQPVGRRLRYGLGYHLCAHTGRGGRLAVGAVPARSVGSGLSAHPDLLVIAAVVQLTELVAYKLSPVLYQMLGIFLPLITTNCAVLGVALLNSQEKHGFLESLTYGFGSALGLTLVIVMFTGMRRRLALLQVPDAFVGTPITLVSAGFLSLAFMGFPCLTGG